MNRQPCLVLGTGNRKKGVELAALFAPLGITVQTLADFPESFQVDETGNTFAENAACKAIEQARRLDRWVLGEDSGLMVDALGGSPGIYSARFSGPGATDASNNAYLLDKLSDTPLAERTAHYVCHMTLSDPSGRIAAESEDVCRGRVVFAPRGEHGFGYDPLFEVVEYHRTFGELGAVVKACLSHRSRAARRLVPQLARLVESGRWR
ncbi:MAG: non-canonical purine NTP pyrophosphatase [Pirellulales bacterium]|nr:non-canonical purine NTP pyrophosphatase [Pirellulales bacterium]